MLACRNLSLKYHQFSMNGVGKYEDFVRNVQNLEMKASGNSLNVYVGPSQIQII